MPPANIGWLVTKPKTSTIDCWVRFTGHSMTHLSIKKTFIVCTMLAWFFWYTAFYLYFCGPARVSVFCMIRVVDLCKRKKRILFATQQIFHMSAMSKSYS